MELPSQTMEKLNTDIQISAAYRAGFSDREHETGPDENITVLCNVFEGLA